MLNHVGYKILGMHTIKFYMAVPGCRTPGHQENNNFCSVNINIGPDDCKWFAVPYEYWSALHYLCECHNIDYLNGSWWPNLDELYENNIPVYKFHQKPGDLVWVSVGCVYWTQAIGFCNSIAWNVGPFTAKQYQAAIESYEWNKLKGFQSIVPMVHLSWNLACKVKMTDEQLYKMIKNCLFLTLRQYYLTLKFVKNKGAGITLALCYDISYCVKCKIELFGILFRLSKNNQKVPYCLDCALEISSLLEGFVCVEEKNIYTLINIYDSFTLSESPTVNSAFTCSQLNWKNLDGLDIDADASTIIEACESKELNSVPECSLLNVCQAPLDPPNQKLQKEQLISPFVPVISLNSENKPWELESRVKAFCWDHPLALIHDLTSIVGFEMKLFWTRNIRKTFRKLKIERRTQMQQNGIQNWDKTYSNKVWKCYIRRSYTTLKEHEKYQTTASEIINKKDKNEDEQIHMTFENMHIKRNKIHLGTNMNIWNFEKEGESLLKEFEKLPSFLQVDSIENNMLSYMGHEILGVNTLQLYLMVPGCRITGQQQNNNLCTVSINVGSGNCEWFVVPYEYWGVIYSLCERNDVDYVNDNWWPPSLNELYEHNVPVYRFCQGIGDIVWLNVGCVYWIQANSICNNIMWNVAPFMATQYQLALERYEWNKLHSFQSIVPMITLSWNLAHETKISDPQLYRLIKTCMLLTLKQYYLLLKFVKSKGVEVEIYNNEVIAPYCDKCLIELFSIVLIQEQRKNPASYCLDCALKCCPLLKGFICLEKHTIEDLMDIYDNFTLD